MVFHHDKAGMRTSLKMPWPENKECAWYFAQTNQAYKGQDSFLFSNGHITSQTIKNPNNLYIKHILTI